MAKFGKERFPENYQSAVGMNARSTLHENSKELAKILKEYDVLEKNDKVFEMGSGPARNLHYIYKEFNTKYLNFYCSDLFKKSALANMSPEIREIIHFFEGDSEDVAHNMLMTDLKLLLVSDHFMHLQYDKADSIIKRINGSWKPEYIMLRELKKEFETPEHPRLFHDYNQFLENYELVHERTSIQDNAYFIWLLKRKQ